MTLKILGVELSVCKVKDFDPSLLKLDFFFAAKTGDELSLVCPSDRVPDNVIICEPGWRAMVISGVLDFSLVGILVPIAGLLAEKNIGIFAVSTYNTDYILVKSENLSPAAETLEAAGYEIM